MTIKALNNGNLQISAGNELERRAIARMRNKETYKAESRFIKRFLGKYGYKQTKPEYVGALTDAPLIEKNKEVYGYMDYQVSSFIEKLAAGEAVIWQKG